MITIAWSYNSFIQLLFEIGEFSLHEEMTKN
jgi:hypothetical protein